MRSGTVSPNDSPKNKDMLAELAMYLAYRLAHPPFNDTPPPMRSNESLESLLEEADRYFTMPNPKLPPTDNQVAYGRELGVQMAEKLRTVMTKSVNKLERVNAARMLALAGKLPCEPLADTYLGLIKDDKVPREIKLFAYHGLARLLAQTHPKDPKNFARHLIDDVKKLAAICGVLEAEITRPYPPKTSPGEIRVEQFIRLEAVKALAQFKNCVVRNNQKVALAKPVWTLLRVARNDPSVLANDPEVLASIKPEDRPDYAYSKHERIEALIGLCTMRPDDKVNAGALAYLINATFIDLGKLQASDRSQFVADERNRPTVPWKITATRLDEALRPWREAVAKLPERANPKPAVALADIALRVFAKLAQEGVRAVPDVGQFDTWSANNKPAAPQIITDDDTTTFRP
jgi:hypothetical protein